ncbi:MAG: 3'(2'),5'-bisphosphate nucleotidase CysQ [Odoribacter sp.]
MESLLNTAIDAALKAGNTILDIYNDPAADFEIERKADNSPLTIADRKANEVIMGYLQNTPYPIISEENKSVDFEVRRHWKSVWVVDPLDGTKEFIKRNGEFTVNIAFIQEGVPLLGVIYIPVKKILYYGTAEKGAFKIEGISRTNGIDFAKPVEQALRLPLNGKHAGCVVVASRSHLNVETEQFIDRIREDKGDVSLTSIGSSIKICLVAEGSADIYPRFAPTMEWDTAAGHAIAKAAGKELYETDEKTPLHYNKENLLNPWFIVK